MTVGEWVADAERQLTAFSSSPRLEAQLIAARTLGISRAALLSHLLDSFDLSVAAEMLQRRLSYEPLAYILGEREFWKDTFQVGPGVLIPRQETEVLVEAALTLEVQTVLDFGTGSGCIALSLARERPEWEVTGLDISPMALTYARANGEHLGRAVRWTEALSAEDRFDLIVSNPPYIAPDHPLAPEIHEHEPHIALYADRNGLAVYEMLAEEVGREHLNPGGAILLEIGYDQAQTVPELFGRQGWTLMSTWPDLSGVTRVVGFRLA